MIMRAQLDMTMEVPTCGATDQPAATSAPPPAMQTTQQSTCGGRLVVQQSPWWTSLVVDLRAQLDMTMEVPTCGATVRLAATSATPTAKQITQQSTCAGRLEVRQSLWWKSLAVKTRAQLDMTMEVPTCGATVVKAATLATPTTKQITQQLTCAGRLLVQQSP
jgi:hypothetical protein